MIRSDEERGSQVAKHSDIYSQQTGITDRIAEQN